MNLIHKPLKYITLSKLEGTIEKDICNKLYSPSDIEIIYTKIYDYYKLDEDIKSIIELIQYVYTEFKDNKHLCISEYFFDKLEYEDKCKLMYGYLKQLDFSSLVDDNLYMNMYKNIQTILNSYIIYKSSTSDNIILMKSHQ